MSRARKDSRAISCNLEAKIADELDNFLIETGLSKTVAIEKALRMYLDNYNKTGKI